MESTSPERGRLAIGPDGITILVGRIGAQRFALPASAVERILPMATVTPFPDAPSGVLGLINLQGEVLPVIDAHPRLACPTPSIQPEQHLVLVSARTRYLLWFDRVEEVIEVHEGAIDEVETDEKTPLTLRVVRTNCDTIPVLSPNSLDPGAIIRHEIRT